MATGANRSCFLRGTLWLLAFSLTIALDGCGKRPEEAPKTAGPVRGDLQALPPGPRATEPPPPKAVTAPGPKAEIGASAPLSVVRQAPESRPAVAAKPSSSPSTPRAPAPALSKSRSLDEQLAELRVPPAWLEDVQTRYDTSRPFGEAREEIRRLLSLNTDAARKEAIKLTWIYYQKNDIGDGHQYPMYVYLGGEPLWAVRAHEEFLAKPHKVAPDHAYVSLASLYVRYRRVRESQGDTGPGDGPTARPPVADRAAGEPPRGFRRSLCRLGKGRIRPESTMRKPSDCIRPPTSLTGSTS